MVSRTSCPVLPRRRQEDHLTKSFLLFCDSWQGMRDGAAGPWSDRNTQTYADVSGIRRSAFARIRPGIHTGDALALSPVPGFRDYASAAGGAVTFVVRAGASRPAPAAIR